jgi:2-methylisocitrate lyase-like PEP mutase family enzyme
MQSVRSLTPETFRTLHESGCFVLPNPWDIGSAKCLQQIGFKALATTSAGLAFSRGLPDTVTGLSRDCVLAHIKEIVQATPLPVNADFQHGYANDPDELAANVKLCVSTGVAGLSIEDASGDENTPLYKRDLSIERIRVARAAIDETQSNVILTARCEAWLVGAPDPFRTALDRLVAFAEAGADCLFAPGVRNPEEIAELVKAVAPKPLNVIVASSIPELTVTNLAQMGVRRISVGSAFARVALGAFLSSARSIMETGSFESLASAASFADLNAIFSRN